MFDSVIDRINKGRWHQILAFFILWFLVYSTTWAVIEPLNISLLESNINLWRWYFVGGTFVLTLIIFFSFIFKGKNEVLGFGKGETDFLKSIKSQGLISLTKEQNGNFGEYLNISVIKGQRGFVDFKVKGSAVKSRKITYLYLPLNDLVFYARINVLSTDKQTFTQKWLRFQSELSTNQSTNDDEEMGIPINPKNYNGLNKVDIDLEKTVLNAFGHHGWKFDKIIEIRFRGSGLLKSITFY